MASLPCNADSLYKVPLNPDPQKGQDLGLKHFALVEPFCPQPLLCFALGRVAAGWQSPAWSRNPSNAGYAVSSSLPPKGQISI